MKNILLAKGQSQKLYTINNKTSTQEINQEFTNHFDKLLNTPRAQQIDNKESNIQLQQILKNLINDPYDDFHVVNTEVEYAIKELNKNKTTDPYAIKAEHYLYVVDEPFLSFITQLDSERFVVIHFFPQNFMLFQNIPIIFVSFDF